jgi:hypothetical protein
VGVPTTEVGVAVGVGVHVAVPGAVLTGVIETTGVGVGVGVPMRHKTVGEIVGERVTETGTVGEMVMVDVSTGVNVAAAGCVDVGVRSVVSSVGETLTRTVGVCSRAAAATGVVTLDGTGDGEGWTSGVARLRHPARSRPRMSSMRMRRIVLAVLGRRGNSFFGGGNIGLSMAFFPPASRAWSR